MSVDLDIWSLCNWIDKSPDIRTQIHILTLSLTVTVVPGILVTRVLESLLILFRFNIKTVKGVTQFKDNKKSYNIFTS